MDEVPVIGFGELFCDYHYTDVLSYGWQSRYERWLRGEMNCSDCQEWVHRATSAAPQYRVVSPPALSEVNSPEHVAQHEAAHIVVARRQGLPVQAAWVGNDEVEVAEGSLSSTGGIELGKHRSSLEQYANVLHAGWSFERQWLTNNGLDGNRSHQLLAARVAGIDMNTLECYVGPYDYEVHGKAMQDSHELFLEHRREINAVAEELVRHRHLGAEAITAALDRSRRSTGGNGTPQSGGQTTTGIPQSPAPSAGAASTATASSSGGNGMGIDEITAAIGNAQQTSEQIRSALAQIQQWSENTTGQLGAVLQGSTQPEVEHSVAAFAQIAQQAGEIDQLVAGAVDGLESYRHRL